MSYDDRIIRENVVPIRRDAPLPLPATDEEARIIRHNRRRDVEVQIYNLHREADDLHAMYGRLSGRTAILSVVTGVLALDRIGWWPLPWLWGLAATSWFTVFVAGMVVFVGAAGVLAALPSLVRRGEWMS